MLRPATIAMTLLLTVPVAAARPVPDAAAPETVQSELATMQRREERRPGPADLEEAIEIALERYGGREVRAETVERDGRRVHEIRVLGEDGSVRTVHIDPQTGAIIPQRRSQD